MSFRNIFTAIALAAFSLGAWAVPAMPGLHRLTQPDGTVVEAYIHGDESFHYYETNAGELLLTSSLLRDFQKALLNIRGLAIYAGDLG